MTFAARLHAGVIALAAILVSATAHAGEEPETRPLSLRAMLEFADEHAPRILVSRAQVTLGEAELEGASVVLQANPLLGAGVGPRFAGGQTGVDVQVRLQQRIEIAGERKQRKQTAKKYHERTRQELLEIRWIVHQEVHAAFHAALVARERWNVAKKLLVSTEELVSVAEGRLRVGDISPLQVKLAKGELAQARQATISAERGYRTAQVFLAELSGWPLDSLPTPAGGLDDPRRAPSTEHLLALALEQHPGVAARTSAVEEAEARVELENREAWPEPWLGVTYAREADPRIDSADHIVLGTISIPIPFSQRNQGERARARAELSVRQAEADAFRRNLSARLARAAIAVDADADRIEAYGTEILPAFEGNLALLRRAFELGEVDLLQVLVARERLLRIQQDALTAHQDYYVDVATLETEVGTEIWPDEHVDHDSTEGETP